MARLRSVSIRLGLALASVLGVLLLFEGALRVTTQPTLGSGEAFFPALPGQVVFDPVRGWRNVPGTWPGRRRTAAGWEETAYTVERHGFRGPEVAERKPPGTVRIFCLGDSATFGVLGEPGDSPEALRYFAITSYSDALRARLAREGQAHVEVINAGVIGYTSHHGLRQLMVQILALEPDVVTVRFGVNDVQKAWTPRYGALEPDGALRRELLYALAGFRTMRLFLGAWGGLATRRAPPDGRDWSTPDQYRRNLERIIDRSRARGVRVMLMDYPVTDRDWSKLRGLEEVTHEVASRHGVPLLQTAPRLLARGAIGFDAADAVHPNERGARMTANLLYERLRALGWLDPASG